MKRVSIRDILTENVERDQDPFNQSVAFRNSFHQPEGWTSAHKGPRVLNLETMSIAPDDFFGV